MTFTWRSLAVAVLLAQPAAAEPILGSGSTFAHPAIAAWSEGLMAERGGELGAASIDAGVDYEAVGSVAGMMRLRQPDVDFAATDAPLDPATLAERGLAQFPILVGGLAVAANLPGLEGRELRLSRAALVAIWTGAATSWSDPAIAAANPDLALPDLPIAPVSRADGSGSTLAFTQYLSAASPAWTAGPGAATRVEWPAGTAVEGSTRVVEALLATEGAVGYVEAGQARRAGLVVAAVENAAGAFVAPSPEAFARTAALAPWRAEDGFFQHLTAIEAPDAYPLTTATFALLRRDDRAARSARTLFFFEYALERGGERAADLGYVPLPADVVAAVEVYWRDALPGGDRL